MARSNTVTLLALDRYAEIMGVSLTHFNNFYDGRAPSASRPYWTQGQHDELALAISQAEEKMTRHLRFSPVPAWFTESLPFGLAQAAWYDDWRDAPVAPTYGYIQTFGRRTSTTIQAGAEVSYSGDEATLTVTNVPAGTTADEIRVYYQAVESSDVAGSDRWEIRPLRTQIAGTTATIHGHKALFALPSVRLADQPAQYTEAANFVTAADVYRVYTNPALPVTLIWDAASGTDPSSNTTQTAAARLMNPETGQFQVRPATWDTANTKHVLADATRYTAPERIEVNYLGGFPLGELGRMDTQLEEAILRLTNVLLPERGIPFCDPATKKYHRDRETDEQTGLMLGELFAYRVAELRRNPEVVEWQVA